MSKFNNPQTKPARGQSPIQAESNPSITTHEGGAGYKRTSKSELFLLAVSNFVGEDSFYEKAGDRDERYAKLIRKVAVEDPEWMAGFLEWLRNKANMRSASLVGALEAAKAMLEKGIPGARKIVASVLQRADEPGEALAYWTSKYGRSVPKPVKRGIADAVKRMYNQYTLLKYDTQSKGYRFGDVIDLTHPTPADVRQGDLFKYALDRRHEREEAQPTHLPMILAQRQWREQAAVLEHPDRLLDSETLKAAGLTWEDAMSALGGKLDKRKVWEGVAPTLGFMALIRNLRNMDEAGVSDAVAKPLAERIADPEQVAKSRQFPFRFFSAYKNAPSLRWGHALDIALQHSLKNLPSLPGRTLILVDTSGSMGGMTFSARSSVTPIMAAAIFGVALAAKGEQVDLYGFADGTRPFKHVVKPGASVLKEVQKFVARTGEDGHGTNIGDSLRKTYDGHDRVVIVSDMQTMDPTSGAVMGYHYWRDPDRKMTDVVPAHVPIYGFNLNGYAAAAMPSNPNRIEFGSLVDATFTMIPLIESGKHAQWPWITETP